MLLSLKQQLTQLQRFRYKKMKLTEEQRDSLLRSNKLSQTVQDRLANKVRLMYHNAPKLSDNATNEQKEAFNLAVEQHQKDLKIEQFAKRYYPLIEDWKSLEKRIFVMALNDFDYEGIEGLEGDSLVDVLAQSEYMTLNIFDLIIDQSFKAISFPPKTVQIAQ